MKRLFPKRILVLISLISVLISCCGQSRHRKVEPNIMSNLTLIKCASGGTRAHIISIKSTNVLSYRVGSFILNNNDNYTLLYNVNYEEIKKSIPDTDVQKLIECSMDKAALSFQDSTIVKDSWVYFVFIDGERIAFGSSDNLESFPDKLKQLINLILGITGELYSLPGFA